LAMKSRQFDFVNSKLKMIKTIGTLRKVDAILLNIKVNQPKLANMCGHKLAMNWQNFTEIELAQVKILQNVFVKHSVLRIQ